MTTTMTIDVVDDVDVGGDAVETSCCREVAYKLYYYRFALVYISIVSLDVYNHHIEFVTIRREPPNKHLISLRIRQHKTNR